MENNLEQLQKKKQIDTKVNLIYYFKVVTKSLSLPSSFMHIKIQYGCLKGTLDCDLDLGFCCNILKEPDFKLYQAILLNFLLHTNTGACRGII